VVDDVALLLADFQIDLDPASKAYRELGTQALMAYVRGLQHTSKPASLMLSTTLLRISGSSSTTRTTRRALMELPNKKFVIDVKLGGVSLFRVRLQLCLLCLNVSEW
jgi:ABC-type dipeptide/oligopeptide/nickel transport system permease component